VAAPSQTILGTDLADNLTTVQASVVEARGGNDIINLSQADDWAKGSTGDDLIQLTQTGGLGSQLLKGQDGNDTLRIGTAAAFAQLAAEFKGGKGGDLIQISSGSTVTNAVNLKVSGGGDADTIQLVSGLAATTYVGSTIKGGDGADSIITGAVGTTFTTSVIQGGKGRDTITYNGLDAANTTRISGGKGRDVLIIGTAATLGSVIGGDGKDSINIQTGATVATVIGGGQKDTITLGAGFLGGVIFGDGGTSTSDGADQIATTAQGFLVDSTINGGGGNDTIRIGSATQGINIAGGNGDDAILMAAIGASGAIISGGAGADTINVGAISGATGNTSIINGGDDADSITVGLSTTAKLIVRGTTTLFGGAGNDTISLGSFSSSGSVGGGDGNDLIVIGTSLAAAAAVSFTAQGTISGGAGSDTINIEISTANVTSGLGGISAGVATIAYAAGDVIHLDFTAGGSNAVAGLVNIGASATISVSGIGGSAAANGGLYAFSDGTDTFFSYNSNSSSAGANTAFKVSGRDLILTTAIDQVVAANSTNVGFTLSGTASTGLSITLT
jgi:hypothetical protein